MAPDKDQHIDTSAFAPKAKADGAERAKVLNLCEMVDHLVDAVGDPGCPLRRIMLLLDIDGHPNSTQNDVSLRMGIEKSVVSRNIDWLVERNAVLRMPSRVDSREILVKTTPFTAGHLSLALKFYGNDQKLLQSVLNGFMDLFKEHMPSLRDLKAIVATAALGDGTKQQIIDNLYGGPNTTDHRTVKQLVEEGILEDGRER